LLYANESLRTRICKEASIRGSVNLLYAALLPKTIYGVNIDYFFGKKSDFLEKMPKTGVRSKNL
jgi:hypothetical protein